MIFWATLIVHMEPTALAEILLPLVICQCLIPEFNIIFYFRTLKSIRPVPWRSGGMPLLIAQASHRHPLESWLLYLSSSLPVSLEKQYKTAQVLGSLLLCGRPGRSSELLTLACLNPDRCGHLGSQPMDKRSLSLSLSFLCLSLPVPLSLSL